MRLHRNDRQPGTGSASVRCCGPQAAEAKAPGRWASRPGTGGMAWT
jgi:hypothetical protein